MSAFTGFVLGLFLSGAGKDTIRWRARMVSLSTPVLIDYVLIHMKGTAILSGSPFLKSLYLESINRQTQFFTQIRQGLCCVCYRLDRAELFFR